MKTTTGKTSKVNLVARYAVALTVALSWVALLKVACVLDRETRAAVAAGERIDHLDRLHVELFGSDE